MVIAKKVVSEIEAVAVAFRSEKGYGLTDPIKLSGFLLKQNVITLYKPLSDKLSGMAIKTKDNKRFMLVNQNHTKGKQHFTIAHELYHLFIQENFTTKKCITALFEKQSDIHEQKADLFASNFLLPNVGIYQMIPHKERDKKNSISTETLFRIQQYYGLSVNAVIHRLIDLDYVDNRYYDIYSNGKIATAKKLGYDDLLYRPGNEDKIIGDYCDLVNKLYQEKKIAESYYLELLNTIHIDPFAQLDKDYDE
jgi:Zn-dependent peptidase ImmA (M78 family)